jgi:hypothetical protein
MKTDGNTEVGGHWTRASDAAGRIGECCSALLPLLLLPVEEDFQRSPLNGTEPGLLMMMTPWYIVGVKASTGSWFPRHHLPP